MEITDVRVRKIDKEGKMKAVVSITIDDEFVIHDIKVIDGEKGLFIAMPSRKSTDGEFSDFYDAITKYAKFLDNTATAYENADKKIEERANELLNEGYNA